MGPKNRPTRSVPERWILNNMIRMVTAIGSTKLPKAGAATASPSTALSTVTAGVIMLSP